jgi:asparagine N-glycosylation enzyme membrane subunit Stt3
MWRSWQERPWHLLLAGDSSNAVEKTRLLVIRTIEDELGLILAAAVMGNRLSNVFLAILASTYAWGFSALVVLSGLMANSLGFFATAKAFYFILTVGAISLFALPILAGLFKSAFGREFFGRIVPRSCRG